MSVTVVVDSTADISPSEIERLGIRVVPLQVHFGDEVFRDKVDLSTADFYRRLPSVTQLPTTSQPSVGAFQEVYESIEGPVISIHLSSRLSGTYQAACLAAEAVGDRIRVIDSGTISLGAGFLAIIAAEHPGSPEEVEAAVRERIPRITIYCALDTLRYVVMGGRVSRARGAFGGMLKVKPILQVQDGEIEQVALARSSDKAMDKLAELVDEAMPLERLAILNGAAEEASQKLAATVAAIHPALPIDFAEIGPVVGTHAGPGVVGVVLLRGG